MKIGDVVALPSGSGKMTVVHIDVDNVSVCWMGYNDNLIHREILPKAIFEPVTASSPPWEKEKVSEPTT